MFYTSGLLCQHGAKYWVQFTDKNYSNYSINNPHEFLSQRSIDRRLKYDIPVTMEDIPVSKKYTDSLAHSGVKVMYTSKWLNGATIEAFDTTVISKIRTYSFVSNIQYTAIAENYKKKLNSNKFEELINQPNEPGYNYYGYENNTITMLNGQFLHNLGLRGNGVQIAIIDAGFMNAENYSTLDSAWNENRILGTFNYVDPGKTVFLPEPHGAECLSLIGALQPFTMVGTAPDASFWLLVSEDVNSENPVEEDNWLAAIEYADSVGADVSSTSLGYTQFDYAPFNHTYSNLNGVTARNSIAASIAVSKGIAVIVAAGNDGNKPWHYIGTPADAKNILAVGSVNSSQLRSSYSSFGPTSDGRIKPDVMAMGENATVQSSATGFMTGSGTSFAAPVIAGLTACLIQAFPFAKTTDILQAIRMSGDSSNNPSNSYGYGLPDFHKAFTILSRNNSLNLSPKEIIFPNPFTNYIIIGLNNTIQSIANVKCYDISGKKCFEKNVQNTGYIVLNDEIQNLPKGLYIFQCKNGNKTFVFKAIKN